MSLDFDTATILRKMAESGAPPLYELSVEEARDALKAATLAMDIPKPDVQTVEDRNVPGALGDIPVRIYWPPEQESEPAPGIVLLFHGGGFVLGDLDTHDSMSRYYAREGGVIIVSVDYRLAPEHRFPAGIEDCYAVLEWVAHNAGDLGGDPARIVLTGDSAGGNAAAVVCQLARSRGGPAIRRQILVYPVVDLRLHDEYESRRLYGNGEYFLSGKDLEWLIDLYLSKPLDATDTRASPILCEDFEGLPDALIITAGYDPLRDEGMAYARRLREAQVPVQYTCFEGTIHGFMSFAGAIGAGREGLAIVAADLRAAMSKER